MASPRSDFIWMSGTLVPWDDAKIHIGSHVVHYGSAVFEGIRCYKTPKGSAVFRLDEHIERLFNSAKIYRMELRWTPDEMNAAILETIRANGLEACYIRPVVYRGSGQLGVNPLGSPVDVAIAVWDWGKYLGDDALEQGVDVCVSSWTRMAPNTLPAMAKSAGNYLNSQLIKMEAVKNGFAEGIALDAQGYVSEGCGENLFVVSKGKLLTPPLVSSILPGHHPRQRHHARAQAPASPSRRRRSRARCSTSPTSSSSPAPRPRSRRSARSTGRRSARAGAARSPRPCRRPSST